MDKIIIYNPTNGAKIEGFIYENVGKLAPHDIGEIKQYDPAPGKALLANYPFLEEKTPQQALQIKEDMNKPKCEVCGYTFGSEAVLETHTKTHQEGQATAEPTVDLSGIPVAEATPVAPNRSADERKQDDLASGPDFYGPGLTETRSPRPITN